MSVELDSRSVRDALLAEYAGLERLYVDFAAGLSSLLSRVLTEEGVVVHTISSRAKGRASLEAKLARAEKGYSILRDVTDLCGVRIITFFPDAVDQIARIIEREFDVDQLNSVDKRAVLDPDRFGYLSLHHVVSLSSARLGLAEYRRFAGLKAEIQTRTVLQHAWAEIEHDLGYKATEEIPLAIRRRLSRLAGLLELADQEFASLRRELTDYARSVAVSVNSGDLGVPLDQESVLAFVRSDPVVADLDDFIAKEFGGRVRPDEATSFDDELVDLAERGVVTLGALREMLAERAHVIRRFAREWARGKRYDTMHRGICLFYLWYVVIAEQLEEADTLAALERARVGPDADRSGLAKRVRAAFRKSIEPS